MGVTAIVLICVFFYLSYIHINNLLKESNTDYFYYHAVLHGNDGKETGYSDIKVNADENKAVIAFNGNLADQSPISIPAANISYAYHTGKSYEVTVTPKQAFDLRTGLWNVKTADSNGIYKQDITPYQSLRLFDVDNSGHVDIRDMLIVFENWATYNRPINTTYSPVTGWNKELNSKSAYTILASYYISGETPDYQHTIYRPRSGLNGMDVLQLPASPSSYLVRLSFNRPVMISVFIPENQPKPEWMKKWKKQSDGLYSTQISNNTFAFTQETPAISMLYFSEENGKPSIEPSTPAGLEKAVPNKECPQWVHDQYMVQASDGNTYRTWHPQIDQVYWCYFGHEHGSNPSLFDAKFTVPFGYAGEHMGMHEKHEGFKVYIWEDILGYRWMVVQHQATSSNQAACGRTHELDFFTKNTRTDEIVSERYFVGDYGVSKMLGTGEPLKPTDCILQGKIQSKGSRFLPVVGAKNNAEEPWIVNGTDVISFNMADFSVDTLDSMRMCSDKSCDRITMTGKKGSDHMISFIDGLGTKDDENHNGIFYTDAMGMKDLKKTDPMAVRQYTKPEFSTATRLIRSIHSNLSTHCKDIEGFGAILQCGIDLPDISAERENSIHAPN